MKRSEINQIIREALAFLERMHCHLPPFAHWSPAQWRRRGPESADIVRQHLGWDITDFGSGDFAKVGLFLFTVRNGTQAQLDAGDGKTYAEKIMIVREQQITPCHTHFLKTEDIINRGGGELVIQLWTDKGRRRPDPRAPVELKRDGVSVRLKAGGTVRLRPGESVTLAPQHFHKFWGAKGKGTVLVGEVSRVNDDTTDNNFVPPCGRFPVIEEDEKPLRLLVGDYPQYYRHGG